MTEGWRLEEKLEGIHKCLWTTWMSCGKLVDTWLVNGLFHLLRLMGYNWGHNLQPLTNSSGNEEDVPNHNWCLSLIRLSSWWFQPI